MRNSKEIEKPILLSSKHIFVEKIKPPEVLLISKSKGKKYLLLSETNI